MKFKMGMLTATKAVAATFDGDFIMDLFLRHSKGDWGDLSKEDIIASEQALHTGDRILSKYSTGILCEECEDVYIITEGDRSSTTMMFVSEY